MACWKPAGAAPSLSCAAISLLRHLHASTLLDRPRRVECAETMAISVCWVGSLPWPVLHHKETTPFSLLYLVTPGLSWQRLRCGNGCCLADPDAGSGTSLYGKTRCGASLDFAMISLIMIWLCIAWGLMGGKVLCPLP